MRLTMLKFSLVAFITSLPALALAHTGHEGHASNSFMTGFLHPLGGFDHLLAMFAIGMCASRLGGRALFVVPAAFVSAMVLGGAAAMAGTAIPFIEQGIVLSVIVAGALLIATARLSTGICAAIAALFALFHGAAHGLEMPMNASGLTYAIGFSLATAALHLAGVALGQFISKLQLPILSRLIGGIVACSGLVMVVA
ncbi:HupE/UreJ family protein [Marinomonas epiphytica]